MQRHVDWNGLSSLPSKKIDTSFDDPKAAGERNYWWPNGKVRDGGATQSKRTSHREDAREAGATSGTAPLSEKQVQVHHDEDHPAGLV